jgi:hypothetical protein
MHWKQTNPKSPLNKIEGFLLLMAALNMSCSPSTVKTQLLYYDVFYTPKGFINTEGETEYRMEQAGSLEAGEFIDMVIEQGDKGDTLAKQFGPNGEFEFLRPFLRNGDTFWMYHRHLMPGQRRAIVLADEARVSPYATNDHEAKVNKGDIIGITQIPGVKDAYRVSGRIKGTPDLINTSEFWSISGSAVSTKTEDILLWQGMEQAKAMIWPERTAKLQQLASQYPDSAFYKQLEDMMSRRIDSKEYIEMETWKGGSIWKAIDGTLELYAYPSFDAEIITSIVDNEYNTFTRATYFSETRGSYEFHWFYYEDGDTKGWVFGENLYEWYEGIGTL